MSDLEPHAFQVQTLFSDDSICTSTIKSSDLCSKGCMTFCTARGKRLHPVKQHQAWPLAKAWHRMHYRSFIQAICKLLQGTVRQSKAATSKMEGQECRVPCGLPTSSAHSPWGSGRTTDCLCACPTETLNRLSIRLYCSVRICLQRPPKAARALPGWMRCCYDYTARVGTPVREQLLRRSSSRATL